MANRWVWVALAALLAWPLVGLSATEETFDLLQVGTKVYTNVTITTKAKDYIFILHSTGMASIKTSQLSPELQEKLGYNDAEKAKAASTNGPVAWARAEVAKLQSDKVKDLRQQITEKLQSGSAGQAGSEQLPKSVLYFGIGIILAMHIVRSLLLLLICRKAGYQPSVVIWVPIFQMVPVFRAAGMTGWWLVTALFWPIYLVGWIIWCFKMVAVRGKSIWLTVFLIFPLTTPFAFLYLALSAGSAPDDDDKREPEIMSLQTA